MTSQDGGATPASESISSTENLSGGLRAWIGGGGCQGESGAFHAWRDGETGALAFEYPEITGYALTYLCGLDDPTSDELLSAKRAADWLVDRVGVRGDLSARAGWDHGSVYNFDLAMIATGLINAGETLKEDRCRRIGVELVKSMASQVEGRGGVPTLGPGSETSRSGWSVDGRAHMLKALQCFLLAEGAGVSGLEQVIDAMAAGAGDVQASDGRFVTQARDDRTMLHPHLYAVEGLWAYAEARGDAEARERARAGAQWAWSQQLPSGGLPRFVAVGDPPLEEEPPEQFDLSAQALRAACLFDLDTAGRERCVNRLVAVASAAAGAGAGAGTALPYQPPPAPRHHNAWVGMFAAQATGLVAGETTISWETLV